MERRSPVKIMCYLLDQITLGLGIYPPESFKWCIQMERRGMMVLVRREEGDHHWGGGGGLEFVKTM